tara:strand:- start:422 stop:586 length:165 start_codon:yes stop_codon:yes gene_type:complete
MKDWKDWKDIIYEEEVNAGWLDHDSEKWIKYNQSFHIDDRTIDKVPRIPINFNT